MTENEYLNELEHLTEERSKAEIVAYQAQEPYRNALRKVDMIKEQIKQLHQAWVNQEQTVPPDPTTTHIHIEIG